MNAKRLRGAACPGPPARRLMVASALLCALCQIPTSANTILEGILLWNEHATGPDSIDQVAFETTFRSLGYPTRHLPPSLLPASNLDSTVLLIAPHAAASRLLPAETAHITRLLLNGLRLITDGQSPLARALGLRLGEPRKTSRIRSSLRPGLRLSWSDSPPVPWISHAPAPGAKVMYTDRNTGNPLGIVFRVGRGRCFYLAPLLDERSGLGFSRFPTLPTDVVSTLGQPLFHRRAAESYFDPAYRADQPPDSLAAAWKQWGIRAIHAAAWYTYENPPYDYQKLIDACHRNAILVYAWLEWPYIGRGFWNNHPEWRQKNALLKDARIDFLYLMDLQNPACMTRALEDLDSLLTLDWDGVDVAEFTLTGATTQGLQGPTRPEWFTGFTEYCREEFRRKEGFDPLELFDRRSARYWRTNRQALDAFYRYRREVNVSTQHRLFSELERIRRQQGRTWELILTIIDNSLHPEFGDLLGFDARQAVALLREFDVTLQVEDPLVEWTTLPQRYAAMGDHYRKLLGDRPFVIDVNIVPMKRERKGKFVSVQAVGTEVFECCNNALLHSDRVCFYCESSVKEQDWLLMPFAMAAGASASPDSAGWTVHAPATVRAGIPPDGRTPLVDGRPWCAHDDSGVLIPAGTHTLRFLNEEPPNPMLRLVAITGELLSARREGGQCIVEYSSRPRCALGFSRRPGSVLIDGRPMAVPPAANDSTCTILGPPGTHTVVLSPG